MDIDTVIIGGGACGLMCAAQAGLLRKKTIVLEKNNRPGAKILISGGGRCNYTNTEVNADCFVTSNRLFADSILSSWTARDTVKFFAGRGILPQEKKLGQLFPEDKKASHVLAALLEACNESDQTILSGSEVLDVRRLDTGFVTYYIQNGVSSQITSANVVVASGGLPVSKIGATDRALAIAKSFGLKIVNTAPALVPLVAPLESVASFAALSGNSVRTRVFNETASFVENILFTHWGLSGPAVLQISSYWTLGKCITIDFLPDQSMLDLIKVAKLTRGGQQLYNLLVKYYPKKMVESLEASIPVRKRIADLSGNDLRCIDERIHRFVFCPSGDKGYDRAEVMRGGVDTCELNPETLATIKIPGLFFGGECVDVTGWLGGYNFQWAWSCGFVIAQSL